MVKNCHIDKKTELGPLIPGGTCEPNVDHAISTSIFGPSSSLSSDTAPRLFDQPFSLDGLGSTLWYVYMHGIFGDADDAPEGAESWHASLPQPVTAPITEVDGNRCPYSLAQLLVVRTVHP